MGNYDDMSAAVAQLREYFQVNSVEDFYLRALNGEVTVDNATGAPLVQAPEALFRDLVQTQDGARFIQEIQNYFAEYTLLQTDAETAQWPGVFRVTHASRITESEISNPISKLETLDPYLGGDGLDPTNPTKDRPNSVVIQVLPPAMNFSTRDTGAIEIFMNTIPAVEFSRCVPYFDLQVITKTPPLDANNKIGNGISLTRFLMGKQEVQPGSADYEMQAGTIPLGVSFVGDPDQLPPNPTVAGMEVFTSPQTLVPSNEVYRDYAEMADVLKGEPTAEGLLPYPGTPGHPRGAPVRDRMRPFMTIEGFDIKVVPTRGMMSHKSATMEITLHDKSRLNEIAYLVKPDQAGDVELLVEYGWSHPDPSTRNPFGRFLNSMKIKEKYGVVNSKYNFTEDGQVSISLSLATRGVDQFNIANVGQGVGTASPKGKVLEDLILLVQQAVSSAGESGIDYSDVIGYSNIVNITPTSANDLVSGENAQEISDFITRFSNGDNPDLSEVAEALARARNAMQGTAATLSSLVDDGIRKCNGFKGFSKSLPAPHHFGAIFTSGTTYLEFGALFYQFVCKPLMSTKQFDEVQCIFYALNDKASIMKGKNIAGFPIHKADFEKHYKKYVEEKVQISVASFLGFMNQYFLSNSAAKAYGFTGAFKRDPETGAAVPASSAGQSGAIQDSVLRSAYGEGERRTFKQPRIRVIPEAVPHLPPGAPRTAGADNGAPNQTRTVLRLHVIDDQADKYSSVSDLIRASNSSGVNAIRTAVAGATAGDGETARSYEDVKAQIYNAASEFNLFGEAGEGGYAQIKAGAGALKHFIKKQMPSIDPSSQHSAVMKIDIGSMHNSADATVHMIRQMRESGDSDDPGSQNRGLPMRIAPMQGKMTTLGCPIMNHGQKFFIDLGTNTSADNVYVVSGLDHKIAPGKFETSVKLIMVDTLGQYESVADTIDEAIAAIQGAGATVPPPPEPPPTAASTPAATSPPAQTGIEYGPGGISSGDDGGF